MNKSDHDTDDFAWLDSIINEEADKREKNKPDEKIDQTDDDADSHWFDAIIDAAVEKRTEENEKILRKLKKQEKMEDQ